ncbi:hypothetical protein O181_004286 [Austropuccinia psidii MF-1]|uniref:Uncharacterized protein n=1 Tax=Austropuccinia psidii MF-1 TaxID=1389203 RepID=A0A9Q3BGK7_9BASI|nr:hypothetical protein [Austropuccinia psidii MF-1]
MDGSLAKFRRENYGSSSQNPPREGDSIISSVEENHRTIHPDSNERQYIFIQDLESLGIEDSGVQNASQEAQEEIMSGVLGVEFKIQQRARAKKRTFQGRNQQITRSVTKSNLPSQESIESVHLH